MSGRYLVFSHEGLLFFIHIESSLAPTVSSSCFLMLFSRFKTSMLNKKIKQKPSIRLEVLSRRSMIDPIRVIAHDAFWFPQDTDSVAHESLADRMGKGGLRVIWQASLKKTGCRLDLIWRQVLVTGQETLFHCLTFLPAPSPGFYSSHTGLLSTTRTFWALLHQTFLLRPLSLPGSFLTFTLTWLIPLIPHLTGDFLLPS